MLDLTYKIAILASQFKLVDLLTSRALALLLAIQSLLEEINQISQAF